MRALAAAEPVSSLAAKFIYPFGVILKQDGQRNGVKFIGSDGWIWVNRDGISASKPDLLATPHDEDLFDYYADLKLDPALLFALQVVRRPAPGLDRA